VIGVLKRNNVKQLNLIFFFTATVSANYQHIAFPGISSLPVVDKTETHSLFPCARAGPILTSLGAGCKIKVIFREFIATELSQTLVFTY